jgi:hypothetical protein
MTVAIGNQPVEVYRKIEAEFCGRLLNLQFTVHEIAMFVYDEMFSLDRGYMTYMVLPVGKQQQV